MPNQIPQIKRVITYANPKLPQTTPEAIKIVAFLKERGIQAEAGFINDENLRLQVTSGEIDLIIALGGDGTMLRVGHLGGPSAVPILGINLGHFGFLIEIQQHEWPNMLENLLKGDYWLEHRMMLRAEQWRGNDMLGSWDVINEVVVCRGGIVRAVNLITHVDGRFLTTYVADGLIASTPTGSTAYALAAGGPILPPELRNILIVPVAPHLSVDRAIVLAEGSYVSIFVKSDHQAVLSADGQPPVQLVDDDRVDIRASEYTLTFVRFQDPGYFYRNLTPHMNQNPTTGNHR